jgi:RNA polymerase sigma factor (sigma-70 family)
MTGAIPFPPTRWSLVGQAAIGKATNELVERYADCLARYLRLRFPAEKPHELEDVVQEVLVHLLEHPELLATASPGSGGKFRYFLATVALNQARNAFRSHWRQQHREQAHDDHRLAAADESADPEAVDQAWQAAVLAAAWADLRGWASDGTLEPEIPALLAAHLVDGTALRELAQNHGLSLATCQRRVAKGRTILQRAIAERGLEFDSDTP